MNASKPLLERRIGFMASEPPFVAQANWPLGKLSLWPERLGIGSFFTQFVLPLDAIQHIEAGWFMMNIVHTDPSTPSRLTIFGFSLHNALERAIRMHNLSIKLKS